jgi:hypothetical protein
MPCILLRVYGSILSLCWPAAGRECKSQKRMECASYRMSLVAT